VASVPDGELAAVLGGFGDLRELFSDQKREGFVMASFFDIRHAKHCFKAMQGYAWSTGIVCGLHYSIPSSSARSSGLDMSNQGTLVVFNLDLDTSRDDMYALFSPFGEVKEVRETPNKRHHKFVEFFDVRHAAAALSSLNKREVRGKCIKIEVSRPGGARRSMVHQVSPVKRTQAASRATALTKGFQGRGSTPGTSGSSAQSFSLGQHFASSHAGGFPSTAPSEFSRRGSHPFSPSYSSPRGSGSVASPVSHTAPESASSASTVRLEALPDALADPAAVWAMLVAADVPSDAVDAIVLTKAPNGGRCALVNFSASAVGIFGLAPLTRRVSGMTWADLAAGAGLALPRAIDVCEVTRPGIQGIAALREIASASGSILFQPPL
jgi:hypothetical protein